MNFISRKSWNLPEHRHTAVDIYRHRQLHRRDFLKAMGISAVGIGLASTSGCNDGPTDQEVEAAGAATAGSDSLASFYPAQRNAQFEYGREETAKRAAAEFTNFFEFSPYKDNWRYVYKFTPRPWTVQVDGLCAKPQAFDLDDIHRRFSLEERAYRHRCVETWAMCIPWTGFRLRDLLALVEPDAKATFVRFEAFHRPAEAPHVQSASRYPWPYTESLTTAEATNELAFLATGIFGEPLPKQHGSPVRLVVPWKYGFKSIKSIVRITLTDQSPPTFWNTMAPDEYDTVANVDPEVPHPRWSQRTEWMLGTEEQHPTIAYNGYGEFVAGLYKT